MYKRFIASLIILTFSCTLITPQANAAQESLNLPIPGTMINLSPAFEPTLIKGLTVHKDNPFLFDFIVDTGNSGLSLEMTGRSSLREESDRLIKYFFACLTVPEKDLWVNLSPYEKDRIVPEALGQTALGRDLLAQDYILKQLTASLIYPEKDLGKEFWNRVYAKAQAMYGSNAQIPVNTFNKVWILADKATVYEHGQTAFVVNGHLKVMLEEDYLARDKNHKKVSDTFLSSQIIRDIVIPEIEKEVNTGKNFATLRQIFNSQILATWYKKNLKEALINQVYTDKNTIKGVNLSDPSVKEHIYQQYLQAYKKGVFNYVKEDKQANGQAVPRKYFSGGYQGANAAMLIVSHDSKQVEGALMSTGNRFRFQIALAINSDSAMAASESMFSKMAEKDIHSLQNWLAHTNNFFDISKMPFDEKLSVIGADLKLTVLPTLEELELLTQVEIMMLTFEGKAETPINLLKDLVVKIAQDDSLKKLFANPSIQIRLKAVKTQEIELNILFNFLKQILGISERTVPTGEFSRVKGGVVWQKHGVKGAEKNPSVIPAVVAFIDDGLYEVGIHQSHMGEILKLTPQSPNMLERLVELLNKNVITVQNKIRPLTPEEVIIFAKIISEERTALQNVPLKSATLLPSYLNADQLNDLILSIVNKYDIKTGLKKSDSAMAAKPKETQSSNLAKGVNFEELDRENKELIQKLPKQGGLTLSDPLSERPMQPTDTFEIPLDSLRIYPVIVTVNGSNPLRILRNQLGKDVHFQAGWLGVRELLNPGLFDFTKGRWRVIQSDGREKISPSLKIEVTPDKLIISTTDFRVGDLSIRYFDQSNKAMVVAKPAGKFADAAMATKSETVADKVTITEKLPPGGIDLNSANMGMMVTKDANGGVKVNFDPAMIERIKSQGVFSADPIIIQITPINATQIRPLLGFKDLEQTQKLAKV